MSVLDAFISTWSSARATFGQGAPTEGAAFDASKQLRQLQTSVESAAPGDRWRGSAADSYAEANRKQGNVLGRMADLDQRLGAEVDRSAAVVAAGRRNLDEVKQWVTDAASSVPPGANREQALMPIARKGIGEVADILKQSNNDLNAIGGRIRAIGNEYEELGGKKENGRRENVVGDRKNDNEPWQYPWDPPPPSDSAPGGGRWDVDYKHPYPSGPGGGPPMGPFAVPPPWHRDVNPRVTGASSGLQDMVSSTPNGWKVDPAATMQEEYRFRLVGEGFNGASNHVRWVQQDGKWYQANWIDYDYQAEHVTAVVPHNSFGGLPTVPLHQNEWRPMSIKDIWAAQAHNPRLTFYLPDISGNPYVISPKTPGLSAG